MNQPTLKTRFCPSPTGLLHLGNIRTALFNALLAKGQHGTFLLRIEDTDKTRSNEQYTEALQEDMHWLALDWDEGPGCEGKAGPYRQSQRQNIYDQYYQELETKGQAYPCFCSEQQLALARKLQRSAGKPPRYAGTCRGLTPEAIAEKIAQGLKPTLRFLVPLDQETQFYDLVRGEQRFNNNDIGDFIIRRADGTPPFMYCNAIDDALMGVTHALRGEDHLTNTPRQIMILQALKLPIPQYGHISLIIGPDNTPLSKRHGSRSINVLREQGYLSKAINNYLARLGHYYSVERLMDLEELAQHFALTSLGSAPARFDANQLLYWQREAVQQMDKAAFWQWAGEAVHQQVSMTSKDLFIASVRPNVTFPADCAHWAQQLFTENWSYAQPQQEILREAGEKYFAVVARILEQGGGLDDVTTALKTELQIKGKMLFQPLRIALTGELHGPELLAIFEMLGQDRLRQRIDKVRKMYT